MKFDPWIVGQVVQNGDVWSAVSAKTGWSPQFKNRKDAVNWLTIRDVRVEGECYQSERKSLWSKLKLFWNK